ncbi:MAG: ATP-binding cassette domain-containing protein [Deltaproteobacteria bacterium]|jgi:iron complex transport system ATP-binding protein|nr:ATP-binding cassette domain-containing protein [Deltaproteobacteria bacterium]
MTAQEDSRAIGLDGISLTRGGVPLLDDLSWDVQRGEHWTVLGPNGAGKTLLLRIVTGYIWPTLGSLTVLGRRLGTVDLRELRRRIGWVSQALSDLLPGQSTLLETIASGPLASLGLYEDPSPELMSRAEAISGDYGLSDKLERPFRLLSSGERQRVLLARAALTAPELLILDEPMSNLDMGGRELFLENLRKLASSPDAPTIVLTTHNTLEIAPFITHAIVIKSGRRLRAGPVGEIMTGETLSDAFDLPLAVEKGPAGRYVATLKRPA